jgi:dTDP-4-dehydrorhamnose 3,5-epimerase
MAFIRIENSKNIDGVIITPKMKIFDDRGAIFHMLREDEPVFQRFGEIYFSQIYAGVVKAFHFHTSMTLNYYLISGQVRLVLIDDRAESPTRGYYQEIFLHPEAPKLVTIPPKVWNGFKGLGTGPSLVANCSTEAHRKDEISYCPHDDPAFGYDWSQRNG